MRSFERVDKVSTRDLKGGLTSFGTLRSKDLKNEVASARTRAKSPTDATSGRVKLIHPSDYK